MSFFNQLQQASFGGVPFGVLGAEGTFGRRQAVHQYPFKDVPWVEDLGKSVRRINLSGFLVENSSVYGGGDVIAQRDALIAVAESPGASTLIHPTLGRLDVNAASVTISERWDQGRYFEVRFVFIEAGQREFPSVVQASGNAVTGSALGADLAAAADFAVGLVSTINYGRAIIATVVQTANTWAAMAEGVVDDATSLFGMVQDLSGASGRFAGGSAIGFLASSKTSASASATVASGVASGIGARANVRKVAASVSTAAASGRPADTASAVQALSAAVLAAMNNPADALRLMGKLANFKPSGYTTSSTVGAAIASTQTMVGNLCRRAAVASLARAASTYQPASSDAAVTVRNQVTAALDAEIAVTGDSGEDQSFAALRALRQAVVSDLNTRGAALPSLKTFRLQASLPSAVLSLRFYRDPSRADEIASETGAPHPAFQPQTVQVLAR
jgi:prophage DNA circulation protein